MIVWVDAQLSPALATWLTQSANVEAHTVKMLGFRDAKDQEIYQAARQVGAVILTKDSDFLVLSSRFGPPPQILWIACGNTATAALQRILKATLPKALELLQQGEAVVEIGG